jgi:hypothetical protein
MFTKNGGRGAVIVNRDEARLPVSDPLHIYMNQSSARSRFGKRLNRGVHEELTVELRLVAWTFTRDRKEAR